MELWDKIKKNWQKKTPEEKKKAIKFFAVGTVYGIGALIIAGPAGTWVASSTMLLKQQMETERKLRDMYLQAKRPMPNSLKKWKEKSRKEKLLSVAKWVGMGVACMAVASVGATGIAAELMGASGIAGIIGGATMTASAGVFGRNALMKEDIKFTNAVYKINNNEKLSPHQKRKAVEQVLGDMNMDNGPLSISFYIDSQDLIMPQNKENKKNSRVSLSEHIKPQDLATAYSHVESKVAWRQKENNTGEKNGANGNVRKLDISDILRNLGGKDIE